MKLHPNSIGIFFVGILILTSCGEKESPTAVSGEKQILTVSTVNVGETTFSSEIKKSGRIIASSSLTLTAQGAGEISKLSVKEGQSVRQGAIIASLKDTQNNYDLRLSQAENALKIAETNKKTTEINLDQSIENSRIAYERAKQSYQTLTQKNGLQDDTLISNNKKTLDSYNTNYKTYLSDIERNLTQMLYAGDKILGISTNFEYANDSWEPYLGTRVGDSRALAVNEWNKAYEIRGIIRARVEKGDTLSITDPTSDLELIGSGYAQTRKYVDAMLYMIQNNLVGAGLSQELQNGWLAEWNGLRSQIQGSESGYNGWKSQVMTFLKTYKSNEIATDLAIKSLARALTPDEMSLLEKDSETKLTFENTRITLQDAIQNSKLTVEQTEKAYDTAIKLREATLSQLEASMKSSSLSLEQARRDSAKLLVTAPVEGTITRVIGSVGQNVSIGTPIAEFSGKQPQMILDIDPTIAENLSIGQSVSIQVDDEDTVLTGSISAISQVASANLLSTIRISIPKSEKYIGKTATVVFSNAPENVSTLISLPINSVNIITEGEGEIWILSEKNEAIQKRVTLGKIYGDTITLGTELPVGTRIIITNMSNYDPNKFTLSIQP